MRTLCYPLSDSQLFCSDKNWIMLLNRSLSTQRQLLWERVDTDNFSCSACSQNNFFEETHNQNYFQGNKAVEVKGKGGVSTAIIGAKKLQNSSSCSLVSKTNRNSKGFVLLFSLYLDDNLSVSETQFWRTISFSSVFFRGALIRFLSLSRIY